MATLVGIIFDVSGSMRFQSGDGLDVEGGNWVKSGIKVIGDFFKNDISSDNKVFAIAIGAVTENKTEIIDILWTLEVIASKRALDQTPETRPAKTETVERILRTLKEKGANTIDKWADETVISKSVSDQMASLILNKLITDKQFAEDFVFKCLPSVCRDWKATTVPVVGWLPWLTQLAIATTASSIRYATEDDVKDVVEKAKGFLANSNYYAEVSNQSIFGIHKASKVFNGVVEENDLTAERIREIMHDIEPYIYGKTPLHKAINDVSSLFKSSKRLYPGHQKLLFIITDGSPTDRHLDINEAMESFASENIKIVGCYISSSPTIEPRRLYNKVQREWESEAKYLFDKCSTIPTELLTRAIFMKRGWKIDIENNETRLFLHVNHPDNLRDACDFALNVVCCQDALSELLVSVDLDIYINQTNTSVQAHEQVGETCYANASAAVLHLAMHRILGRHKFDFETFRDEMISRYGIEGADTLKVLQQICPQYRLRCKKVDFQEAMKAIAEKRPVVARFRLTNNEWNTFRRFFKSNPNGILKKKDLDISMRNWSSETSGHAVVLTSYNSECLRLMNSWGENWAEKGFFKVETADVLGLEFIDVYWEESDLTADERSSYRAHGSKVARKLMSLLKGLQVAMFQCLKCSQWSLVTEFRGTLSHVICPKCRKVFSSNDGNGNILALNVHLTSLSST